MLQGENGVVVVDVCATQLYGSAGQPANLARHPPMWWYSSDMKLWQNFIISASLRPLGSKSDPPYFWHSKAGSRIGRTSAFTSAVFLRSVKHRPAAAACLATAHGQRRQSVLEALLKAAGTGVIKVKVKVRKSLHRLNFPVLTSSFRPLFDLPDAPSAVPPTSSEWVPGRPVPKPWRF